MNCREVFSKDGENIEILGEGNLSVPSPPDHQLGGHPGPPADEVGQ